MAVASTPSRAEKLPSGAFHYFVATADAIGGTTKKLEKTRLLTEYLRSLSPDDGALAAVFFTGRAFAQWEERVLGVGGSQLSKILLSMTGVDGPELHAIYRKYGDLGDAAQHLLAERTTAHELSLPEVAETFARLAQPSSSGEKIQILRNLFEKGSAGEVKYLIKIATADLRIGLKESLVEEAIAKAFERPLVAVRRANMLLGDIGETLRRATSDDLDSVKMRLFHPIGFMLANPAETAEEIIGVHPSQMFIEEKYDGIRAQIHKSSAGVKMFARTLNEILEFPELIAPISAMPGEFILDGEIIAWQGSQPMAFTELQKRLGRKQVDMWLQQDIPVKFVAFDLLFLAGDLLIELPLAQRREKLNEFFAGNANSAIRLAPARLGNSADDITLAFQDSLAAGHEGIVAKAADSPYTPGRRGGFWFKLKQPLATLDVIVTAAEYGHGRRHAVLSDYTFAVRDGDRLLNIGKAYSGLTDAEIDEYTKHFLQHVIDDQGSRKIVEPNVVIEVAFNNMQRSARHASGFALRFPRIVRLRPDKPPSEIDTLERVRELYSKQVTLERQP